MRENTDQNNSEHGHFLRSVREIDFWLRCLKRRVRGCCTRKFWQHWLRLSHKHLSWKTFLSCRRFVRFLIVLLYIFQSQMREKKCCDNIFLQAYNVIYKSIDYEFENIGWMICRFSSTFFKFDLLKKEKDKRQLKKKKLNNWIRSFHCCIVAIVDYLGILIDYLPI